MADDLTLYHYTTLEAFEKILSDRVLWATDSRFLNDLSEVVHARHVIKSMREARDLDHTIFPRDEVRPWVLSRLEREIADGTLPPIYIASFAAMDDRLSIWRGYSRTGIGVSFGVRQSLLAKIGATAGFELLECSYAKKCENFFVSQDPQVDRIWGLIDTYQPKHEWGSGEQPDNWAELVSKELSDERLSGHYEKIRKDLIASMTAFKHPTWEEEVERRLVKIGAEPSSPKFRCGGSATIPYADLPLPVRNNKLILDSVRFWGSTTPQQTIRYIHSLLEGTAVATETNRSISVEQSKNPFRPRN